MGARLKRDKRTVEIDLRQPDGFVKKRNYPFSSSNYAVSQAFYLFFYLILTESHQGKKYSDHSTVLRLRKPRLRVVWELVLA